MSRPELEEFLRGSMNCARPPTASKHGSRGSSAASRARPDASARAARLLEIQRALVRHGLDDFVRATHLYRPFRFLFYLSPWTWFQRSAGVTRGERLRLALEELGPIFVKFGQALSTRRDLLPADIADELAKLQDRVPPFRQRNRHRDHRAGLRPAARGHLLRASRQTPLAAASIAQVHAATLKSGEEVVVKILRPGMHEIIERDLEVLRRARRAGRRVLGGRATPAARSSSCSEYRKTILDELDLMREAGNAAQLKRNFAGSTAPLRARGLLGLLPDQRHGHGAHPRHHREPHGRAARARHQHRQAGRERRGDLLHAGVPT